MFFIYVKKSVAFPLPFTILTLLLFQKELLAHPLVSDPLLYFPSLTAFMLAYAVNLFYVGRIPGYTLHNLLFAKAVALLASIAIFLLTFFLGTRHMVASLAYSLILLSVLIPFLTLLFGPLCVIMVATLPLSIFCPICTPIFRGVFVMQVVWAPFGLPPMDYFKVTLLA